MVNRWMVFLFAIFMVYSITKRPEDLLNPIKKEEIKPENYKIMEQIKTYADQLTKDGTSNLNENKNSPIILEPEKQSTSSGKKPLKTDFPLASSDEKYKKLEGKVYNFIYNMLHTKQGQDLLERALTNPTIDKKDPNKLNEVTPYQNNSIMNIIEGEGAEAHCGDVVTAHFTTRLVNGQTIEDTKAKNTPKTFTIGEQEVIKGIEFAAIGMKKGSQRRLITLPKYAYTQEKFSKNLVGQNEFVTIDIFLVDVKPPLSGLENIKIFQDHQHNKGSYMLCGDRIYFNYILKDSRENIISKSRAPVSIILGKNNTPKAITRAFEGIKSRSQRTVIFPSHLLQGKKINFLPANVKVPTNEMLIFEIDTDVGAVGIK